MRGQLIGIISEGAEDFGVLKNIFRAFGFDGSEIIALRPALSKDATDRHNDPQTIGTFQGVKNACVGKNGKRPDFENFFERPEKFSDQLPHLYNVLIMILKQDPLQPAKTKIA